MNEPSHLPMCQGGGRLLDQAQQKVLLGEMMPPTGVNNKRFRDYERGGANTIEQGTLGAIAPTRFGADWTLYAEYTITSFFSWQRHVFATRRGNSVARKQLLIAKAFSLY